MRTCNSVIQNRCRKQGRSVFGGICSTACLEERNRFHSIPLSQWHSSRSEKKKKEVCWLLGSWTERGSHRAFLRSRARCFCKNQAFSWPVDSSQASSAKLDIVKVDKGRIWDKLGAIWLFNSNETRTSQTKIIETKWDNYIYLSLSYVRKVKQTI